MVSMSSSRAPASNRVHCEIPVTSWLGYARAACASGGCWRREISPQLQIAPREVLRWRPVFTGGVYAAMSRMSMVARSAQQTTVTARTVGGAPVARSILVSASISRSSTSLAADRRGSRSAATVAMSSPVISVQNVALPSSHPRRSIRTACTSRLAPSTIRVSSSRAIRAGSRRLSLGVKSIAILPASRRVRSSTPPDKPPKLTGGRRSPIDPRRRPGLPGVGRPW